MKGDVLGKGDVLEKEGNAPSGVTLKALANFSPGLRFGNPGGNGSLNRRRNPEGVASSHYNRGPIATLFRVAPKEVESLSPGLPKRNPGLKLANTFGVIERREH